MKKVTRLSLNEGTKAMPVLTEDEQRACVGGTFYYTDDGTYLGSLGPGTEIRITDANAFNTHSGFNSSAGGIGDDSDLYGTSSGIGGVSASTQWNIMNEIASGMGIGHIAMFNGPSNVLGKWHPERGIQINANGSIMDSGNYYDFYLTLLHEKQHRDTPEDRLTNQSEYEAYSAVVFDENFDKASEVFKSEALKKYNKYKKLVNEERLP